MASTPAMMATNSAAASRHPQGQLIPQKPRGPTRIEYRIWHNVLMLTVRATAERLQVSERMVRRLIELKRLKAEKLAGAWFVNPKSLKQYVPQPVGGRIKGKAIKADSLRRRRDRAKASA